MANSDIFDLKFITTESTNKTFATQLNISSTRINVFNFDRVGGALHCIIAPSAR